MPAPPTEEDVYWNGKNNNDAIDASVNLLRLLNLRNARHYVSSTIDILAVSQTDHENPHLTVVNLTDETVITSTIPPQSRKIAPQGLA
jgi:hypothetical protein